MIYLLTCAIVLLIAIIIYVRIDSRNSVLRHQKKTELLREMIVHLLNDQSIQSEKIRLAEELREKLNSANKILSVDISEMMHDFIDTLSQNDLLKK